MRSRQVAPFLVASSSLALVLALLALVLVAGCGKDAAKPVVDASPASDEDATDAGSDAAGPLAQNQGLVKRYDDETAVDHVAQTIAATTADVVNAYPKGKVLLTLPRGQATVQLAERDGYELITFADPADASRTSMGWVAKFVFAELDAGKPGTTLKAPWCSGTKVLVIQEGDGDPHDGRDKPRCDYVCNKDGECRDGATCEAALELDKSGLVPPTPTYTTVCTPPAGPLPGPRDSGVPSLYGASHLSDGKCPAGYAPAPKISSLCFMSCKVDSNCPEDARCRTAPSAKDKLCFAN